MGAPNILATLMLAAWPIFGVFLFRRFPPAHAFLWTLVVGYLLLPPQPAGFDFPILPPLDKDTIPPLVVFITALLMYRGEVKLWPEDRTMRVLIVMFVIAPFPTFFTNTEPVFFGFVGLPGMRITEAAALMMQQFMLITPFLLARHFLGDEQGRRLLFWTFLVAGLAYSLPMMMEVRLAPQINLWVYGYFQHYFAQMVRFGGYRPMVFLYHGLWAAFFAMMAMTMAMALMKEHWREKGGTLLVLSAGYLVAILIMCKSVGSALYGIALIPLVLFLKGRSQIRIAAFLAVLSLAYPVMKQFDLVPVDWMLDQAAKIQEDRKASLEFRFDNEDVLFERAQQKAIFGWGSWGRNHILDPVSGLIKTVTDGRWIITIGVYGWFGFIAEFGLLIGPILLAWREARRPGAHVPLFIGPMALLLAINVVDLIPNATLTTLTWVFAGTILGAAEKMRRDYVPPETYQLKTVL